MGSHAHAHPGEMDAEGEYDDELLGSDDGAGAGVGERLFEPESDDEMLHDEHMRGGGDERRFAPKRRVSDREMQYTYPRAAPPSQASHGHGHGHGQNHHEHGRHHGHATTNGHGHHSGETHAYGRYKLSAASSYGHSDAGKYGGSNGGAHAYRSAAYADDISMDEDEPEDGVGEGDYDVEMAVDHRDSYRERSRHGHGHGHGSQVYSNVRGSHYSQAASARRYKDAPARLADLDNPTGRLSFISSSVRHLFKTTYERGDELTIGALVNYLNAAMPTDKHEDFDVQEVTRAAASLAKSGTLVQEGDLLRPRD